MFAKLSRTSGRKKTSVKCVRKYSNYTSRATLADPPPVPKPLDTGRLKHAIRSEVLEEQHALMKEMEAEFKKFKETPVLNETARDILKDLKGVIPDKGLKELEAEIAAVGDPNLNLLEYVKGSDLLPAGDPTYNARVTQVFMKHYEKLYKKLTSLHGKDKWKTEFYDYPARKQAGIQKLKDEIIAARNALKPKFGAAAAPILHRIYNLMDLGSETPFSNIPSGPIRVAITGASGQIGYALAFRIAAGGLFGPNVPVHLHLLELPQAMQSLKGLVMELEDCAYPSLAKIVATDNPDVAFEGVDWALLVGASPRTKGMERGDLLLKNAEIFSIQGKSLDRVGKKAGTRVAVVGNPANTNALIAQQNAPSIPAENFSAMTRLDHNRGLSQLAAKLNCHVTDIHNFVIWGNHSATQFPDISHAYVNVNLATGNPFPGSHPGFRPDNLGHRLLSDMVDQEWLTKSFIPTVQQRGAAIIAARGVSSAQSAASSLIDSVHDWQFGTQTEWTSAAVVSKGEYGVTKGLFYSYPVIYNNDCKWDIVKHLPIDEFSANLMEATHKELLQERDAVTKFLPGTSATGGGFGLRRGSGPDGDGLDLNYT